MGVVRSLLVPGIALALFLACGDSDEGETKSPLVSGGAGGEAGEGGSGGSGGSGGEGGEGGAGGSDTPWCGNGVVEEGEACDDGNDTNPYDGCHMCAYCGDGILGGIEGCDEGDANGTGGPRDCRADCTKCGDGIIDPHHGEECDDADVDDSDGCLSNCVQARCGDGVIRVGGEECDDGNTVDGDGCSSDCRLE